MSTVKLLLDTVKLAADGGRVEHGVGTSEQGAIEAAFSQSGAGTPKPLSAKPAEGHVVECRFATPDGAVVRGVIEKAFFEDFMGMPDPKLSLAQRSRIIQDNIDYFEREAARQWSMGKRDLVIS